MFKTLEDVFAAAVDLYRINRSGLFQSEAYKQRYVVHRLWRKFPLLHYVLIGERSGFRPNCFFSPNAFFSRCGTRRFGAYLTEARFWASPISPQFDPAHLEATSPCPVDHGQNPLIAFWRSLFDEDVSPAPGFDLAFVKHAAGRDAPDKRAFLFRITTTEPKACHNVVELRRRQDAFRGKIELNVIKESRCPRKNLTFVQASADYRPVDLPRERSYDFMVNCYDRIGDPGEGCDSVLFQTGTKATAIAKILAERRYLLDYDHVLFLDDDVEIDSATIEHLFATAQENELDLAQPSLSARSATHYAVLKQPNAGRGLTRLNAVEIMAPLFSRRALAACEWTFKESVSGWGLDYLIGAEVIKTCGTTPTLVGSCVAEHLRPLDTDDGPYYRMLREQGIDARTEAGAIIRKYLVPGDIYAV